MARQLRAHMLLERRAHLGEARGIAVMRKRERDTGKNLACWCRPGESCQVDVLLEIANPRT